MKCGGKTLTRFITVGFPIHYILYTPYSFCDFFRQPFPEFLNLASPHLPLVVAGVKWMAGTTNLHLNMFFGGPNFKCVSASTLHLCLWIVWGMNIFFCHIAYCTR